MIAFVAMSRNEADIARDWARHAWAQGADMILVADGMSTDGTPDLLRDENVTVIEDREPFCYQARVTSDLAARAVAGGASWVVPADLDEFWCATNRQLTVAEACTGDVSILEAKVFHYQDRDWRWPEPKQLPKVAFRWQPGCEVTMGNHGVTGVDGRVAPGRLEVREIPYRGRDHFKRKVRERLATLDPELVPGDADHYRRLAGFSETDLDAEWDRILSLPTVYDPI